MDFAAILIAVSTLLGGVVGLLRARATIQVVFDALADTRRRLDQCEQRHRDRDVIIANSAARLGQLETEALLRSSNVPTAPTVPPAAA